MIQISVGSQRSLPLGCIAELKFLQCRMCPGYRMMSVTHPDLCRRVALRYSAACIGICSAAPILGLTTWAFAVDSLILNLYFTFLAYRSADAIFLLSHKAVFRIHDFLVWIRIRGSGSGCRSGPYYFRH